MEDGRKVTQEKIWNGIDKADKRKITSSAQPVNRDGTPASKEQVQQRRWGR
jgi:hypothetical protein